MVQYKTGLTMSNPHGYEVHVFHALQVREDGKDKTVFTPVHVEDLLESGYEQGTT